MPSAITSPTREHHHPRRSHFSRRGIDIPPSFPPPRSGHRSRWKINPSPSKGRRRRNSVSRFLLLRDSFAFTAGRTAFARDLPGVFLTGEIHASAFRENGAFARIRRLFCPSLAAYYGACCAVIEIIYLCIRREENEKRACGLEQSRRRRLLLPWKG